MSNSLESRLDLVEQQFNEVASLVASGEPSSLQEASAGLQAVSVELIQSLSRPGRPAAVSRATAVRLKQLGEGLGLLRQNLARRQAQVNQALGILVPTAAPSTYAQTRGAAASPYGQAVRNSGAFSVLKA